MLYYSFHALHTVCGANRESSMSKYEISNVKSAHSFGVYEAESAEAAIEACCKDAGYESKEQAEDAMGHESELVAVEVQ